VSTSEEGEIETSSLGTQDAVTNNSSAESNAQIVYYVNDENKQIFDKQKNTRRTDMTPLNQGIVYSTNDLFTPQQRISENCYSALYAPESTREVTKRIEGSSGYI